MSEPLSVGRLFQILVRFWLMIVIVSVAAAAASFIGARALTPTYTATATQLVKAVPGVGGTANYEAAQYAVARAKSYPSFVYSIPVLEGVRSDLGNVESVDDLRHDLSATNPADTPLVQLTATGTTAAESQLKANSLARNLALFVSQIETVGGKSPVIVETAVQAAVPESPTSPQVPLFVAVGALAGFSAAFLLAVVLSDRASTSRKRAGVQRKAVVWWDDHRPQPGSASRDTRAGHEGPTAPRAGLTANTPGAASRTESSKPVNGDHSTTEQVASGEMVSPPAEARTNGVATKKLRAKPR